MPTYEYTCKSCGENIEVFQSFSSKPLKKHDVCGGDLQKVFHARGVVFKGSGWYAKDSKAAPASASSDKSADKSSDKSDKSAKPKEKATSAAPKAVASKESAGKDSAGD